MKTMMMICFTATQEGRLDSAAEDIVVSSIIQRQVGSGS